MEKNIKWTIEYYRYREYYCIVGTTNSFFDYDGMKDYYTKNYGACDFVEIKTPEYANDNMLVW